MHDSFLPNVRKGALSMGVYIKGMEMPVSCLNCFLSRSGCRAVLKRMRAMEAGTWIPANYRHDDCPLVPVPKHGDLIDRNELMKHKGNCYDADGHLLYAVGTGSIMCAPTIIPAEEGE